MRVVRLSLLSWIIWPAITAAIVGVALYLMPVQSSFGQAVSRETIDQPLQGAKQASVGIAFGVGSLRLGALSDSNALIQGNVAVDGGAQLTQSFQVTGDTANYQLGTRTSGSVPFFPQSGRGGTWDLPLIRDVPIQL